MQFGEKIRVLRQQAGLTQPDLAQRLNCEQSWLSKIETGKVAPAGEFIQAVLNYFELSLDELIQDVAPSHLKTELGAIPAIAGHLHHKKTVIHRKRKGVVHRIRAAVRCRWRAAGAGLAEHCVSPESVSVPVRGSYLLW